MPIVVAQTPNPNATKFSVGQPVGGPVSYATGSEPDNPLAAELVAIEGVTSVFLAADFVTVSKSASAEWESIVAAAKDILEGYFHQAESAHPNPQGEQPQGN